MHVSLSRQRVPSLMAATRILLGPIVIIGQAFQWSSLAIASLVVVALVTDIFDGILARRWHCDTPAGSLFDSMADTAFYLCMAVALGLRYPHLWKSHLLLFGCLLTLEIARFIYDFAKFGKPASYHSTLAKTWGFLIAPTVVAAFLTPHADNLIVAALGFGIVCDLEGLTMSFLLPTWHHNVRSLRRAYRLRNSQLPSGQAAQPTPASPTRRAATTLLLLALFATPALTAQTIPALYDNGSSPTLPAATTGTLDLTSPTDLIFRSTTGATLSIPYHSILAFNYRVESTHHLGVIPAILVALVNSRMHRHLFTLNYTDAANAKQVAVFDVPKNEPRVLLPLLRLRTSACAPKSFNCGGTLETSPFQ